MRARTAFWAGLVAAAGLAAPAGAPAQVRVSQIVVFGDSLSDTGNVQKIVGVFPDTLTNYDTGRFTNGPGTTPDNSQFRGVFHEQLATILGVAPAVTSARGGLNFAFGGATTGQGTTTYNEPSPFGGTIKVTVDNIGKQVDTWLAGNNGGLPPSGTLAVIEGGGNDLVNLATAGAPAADILAAEKQAVANIAHYIDVLAFAGVRAVLWPDLPPLEATPRVRMLGADVQKTLATASANYRTDELNEITTLGVVHPALAVADTDVYGLVNGIIAGVGKNGYTNVTDPARGNQNANPDQYLFWDRFHPTTHVHHDVAVLAARDLQSAGILAVPEPPVPLLAAVALAALLPALRVSGRARPAR